MKRFGDILGEKLAERSRPPVIQNAELSAAINESKQLARDLVRVAPKISRILLQAGVAPTTYDGITRHGKPRILGGSLLRRTEGMNGWWIIEQFVTIGRRSYDDYFKEWRVIEPQISQLVVLSDLGQIAGYTGAGYDTGYGYRSHIYEVPVYLGDEIERLNPNFGSVPVPNIRDKLVDLVLAHCDTIDVGLFT